MKLEMTTTDTAVGPSNFTASPVTEGGISLTDIFRMLQSHAWFIVLCGLIGLGSAILYVRLQKPIYEATATLRIDPSRAGSLGLSDLVANPSSDQSDVVHTAIALIKSDGVAIRTLNSLNNDQYNQFVGSGSARQHISADSEVLSRDAEAQITRLESNTVVSQEEGTQLLQVKFRDHNPQIAATIANHLVDAYELENFSSRDRSVSQLQTWLSSQMKTLRAQVKSSQEKLAAFQEANQIIPTTDAKNITTDRLSLLNDKLAEAQANRITKEAQMRAAMTGDPATLASLFPNPRLQALQTEQGNLYSQYAQLSTKFGPKYSPLVEMKQQLELIEGEIAGSVRSVRGQLQQEYEAALNTQMMLQEQYDEQTKLAYGLNRNQAEYAELQAEVTSSRELYDTLQRKLQQAAVDTQVNSVETAVVDSARAPILPVLPKKSLTIISGLILGLFAGIASSFIFESSSDLLRNPEQVERTIGYRTLAMIPVDTLKRKKGISDGEKTEAGSDLVTLENPLSQSAEAFRILRNSLLSSRSGKLKTILFTSTLPGEGLTTVVANFAVSLAQTGARVLVLDADLRKPRLHERFGAEDGVGLGNYLSGRAHIPFTKQPLTQLPNLSLVTSGERPALPSESLASENFRSLPQKLEASYDYIIIKSAPLLMVSDGLPLASWADCTVVVAQYGVTGMSALSTARRLLYQSNAKVAGLVILDVPPSVGLYAGHATGKRDYYA